MDLAGSERMSRREASPAQQEEARHINLSLAAFSDCIYALCSRAKHVPYRDSKLTHLLQVRCSRALPSVGILVPHKSTTRRVALSRRACEALLPR